MQDNELGLDDIFSYWKRASKSFTDEDNLLPTARDPYLQAIVESLISKWIYPSAKVFDFGCGEGTSTLTFSKLAAQVIGFDFIEEFVCRAKENAAKTGIKNVEFKKSDILNIGDEVRRYGQADIIVTIRCLINLATWQNQAKAIDNIYGMLKPGGLYLLSEGWEESWAELNRARARSGVEPIELVKYNRLINKTELERHIQGRFRIEAYLNSGFYIFMSRVFQPLFVAPNKPAHTHAINRVSSELLKLGVGERVFEELDYSGVYVLRKI